MDEDTFNTLLQPPSLSHDQNQGGEQNREEHIGLPRQEATTTNTTAATAAAGYVAEPDTNTDTNSDSVTNTDTSSSSSPSSSSGKSDSDTGTDNTPPTNRTENVAELAVEQDALLLQDNNVSEGEDDYHSTDIANSETDTPPQTAKAGCPNQNNYRTPETGGVIVSMTTREDAILPEHDSDVAEALAENTDDTSHEDNIVSSFSSSSSEEDDREEKEEVEQEQEGGVPESESEPGFGSDSDLDGILDDLDGWNSSSSEDGQDDERQGGGNDGDNNDDDDDASSGPRNPPQWKVIEMLGRRGEIDFSYGAITDRVTGRVHETLSQLVQDRRKGGGVDHYRERRNFGGLTLREKKHALAARREKELEKASEDEGWPRQSPLRKSQHVDDKEAKEEKEKEIPIDQSLFADFDDVVLNDTGDATAAATATLAAQNDSVEEKGQVTDSTSSGNVSESINGASVAERKPKVESGYLRRAGDKERQRSTRQMFEDQVNKIIKKHRDSTSSEDKARYKRRLEGMLGSTGFVILEHSWNIETQLRNLSIQYNYQGQFLSREKERRCQREQDVATLQAQLEGCFEKIHDLEGQLKEIDSMEQDPKSNEPSRASPDPRTLREQNQRLLQSIITYVREMPEFGSEEHQSLKLEAMEELMRATLTFQGQYDASETMGQPPNEESVFAETAEVKDTVSVEPDVETTIEVEAHELDKDDDNSFSKIHQLNELLEKIQKSHDVQENIIHNLRQDQKESRETIKGQQLRIEQLEHPQIQEQKSIKAKDETISQLERELQNSYAENKSLEKSLEDASTHNQTKDNELNTLGEQLSSAEQENSLLISFLELSAESPTTTSNTLPRVKSLLLKSRTRSSQLQNVIEHCDRERKLQYRKIQLLQEQLDNKRTSESKTRQQATEDNEELTAKLSEACDINDGLRVEIDKLEEGNNTLSRQVKHAKLAQKRAEKTEQRLLADLRGYEDEIELTKRKLQYRKDQVRHLKEQKRQLLVLNLAAGIAVPKEQLNSSEDDIAAEAAATTTDEEKEPWARLSKYPGYDRRDPRREALFKKVNRGLKLLNQQEAARGTGFSI